jgi:ABC-2 type transport system permease protein
VSRFAQLAAENLDVSKPILASIANPVRVNERALAGSSASLDVFGVEVAVVLSLMFVTLLLAAGMLALEREEHAFGRLVRGLVSRTGLLAEKIGLAGLCAWALAAVMLAVLVAFLDIGWSRTPLWLLALAFSAVAFAALGVAIGGLTREVRAASLLAFMLALPVAALALVPSGAVNGTLYDVIRIVSGAFPFKPSLSALDAALSGGTLLTPLLHLAALTLAFTAIARVALRRFG